MLFRSLPDPQLGLQQPKRRVGLGCHLGWIRVSGHLIPGCTSVWTRVSPGWLHGLQAARAAEASPGDPSCPLRQRPQRHSEEQRVTSGHTTQRPWVRGSGAQGRPALRSGVEVGSESEEDPTGQRGGRRRAEGSRLQPPLGFRPRQLSVRSQSHWTECSESLPVKIFKKHTSI